MGTGRRMPIAQRYVQPVPDTTPHTEQQKLDAGTPQVQEPMVNAGWGYDPEKD